MNILVAALIFVQCAAFLIWAWVLGVVFTGTKRHSMPQKEVETSRHGFYFTVIICAHNEERVIRELLESLKAQTYPSDFWKAYLIADRCTDGTCRIAEQYDFVTILRREEAGESRKGLALQWGIEKIRQEGQGNTDIIMVLDADNKVIPEFLELFNKKFLTGSRLVTGKRVAMNPYQTLVSKWYAIYWSMVTELFCCSHHRLALSSLLSGTGFAFSAALLGEDGFHTLSMSEDIEFSVQQNLKGIRVDYLEEAIFYDEQPTTIKMMVRQLRRWTTGCYQIVWRYSAEFLKKIIHKPSFMLWDSFLSLLVCGNMGIVLAAGIGNACVGLLYGGPWSVFAFFMGIIPGVITFIIGNIAVRKSSLDVLKMLDGVLLFPVFYLLFSCVSLYSAFRPQRKWHKIEHYGVIELDNTEGE